MLLINSKKEESAVTHLRTNRKLDAILLGSYETCGEPYSSVGGERYERREVNWSRFLYDKADDVYIPEEVYLDILFSQITGKYAVK